jgi:hypothetical protein
MNLTYHHQKIDLNGQVEYAEVQFYFLHFVDDPEIKPVPRALVSVYSRPLPEILEDSCNTLWACQYTGSNGFRVVDLPSIVACVSMQPLPPLPADPDGLYFVVEKSGLEDAQLTGFEDLDPLDLRLNDTVDDNVIN